MIVLDNNFNNNKKAFSLAESVISMMLLVLVILLTMSSITKKKTSPNKITTISGMYACWNDGEIKQAYYEGQRKTSNSKIVATESGYDCTFQMDRRVYKYYIYAIGTRYCLNNDDTKCTNGQVDQKIKDVLGGTNNNNMKLNIKLGNKSNGGMTEVYDGTNMQVAMAKGGIKETKSGLADGNIKDCKYISNIGKKDNDNKEYKVICKVQNSEEEYRRAKGENPYKTSLLLQRVNIKTNSTTGKIEEVTPQEESCQIQLDELEKNTTTYSGPCLDSKTGNVWNTSVNTSIKVMEKDSALKATYANSSESEFVKHLKMIPQNKQNGLSDTLLDYYLKDNKYKYGIVFIMW